MRDNDSSKMWATWHHEITSHTTMYD